MTGENGDGLQMGRVAFGPYGARELPGWELQFAALAGLAMLSLLYAGRQRAGGRERSLIRHIEQRDELLRRADGRLGEAAAWREDAEQQMGHAAQTVRKAQERIAELEADDRRLPVNAVAVATGGDGSPVDYLCVNGFEHRAGTERQNCESCEQYAQAIAPRQPPGE